MHTNSLATSEDPEWTAIVDISDNLLTAIQEGSWENVAQQAQYRHMLIKKYFAKPVKAEHAPWLHEAIKNVLAVDNEIISHVKHIQGNNSALRQALGIQSQDSSIPN